MKHIIHGFFSALVVLCLAGAGSAETTNVGEDNAREMKQPSTEAQEENRGTGAGVQKSIETQGATNRESTGRNENRGVTQKESVGTNQNGTVIQQEPVGIIDQLKEGAKGEVDLRGKELNDRIDRFGQQ